MIGSIKASTRVDHRSINNNLQSENKMSKKDILIIEENDVSNQGTQREHSSNFDRSKSSRVAQQIDDVYREH